MLEGPPSGPRTVAVDCHVHTEASYDSRAPLTDVLAHAARSHLDGLVIADHDRIDAALQARELAHDYDLVVVPGVEVSTADGHLLAIDVTERPEPGRPLAETVEAVRAQGGLAVVPHPFQRSRHGTSAAAVADCDGVETFNAHSVTGVRNRQAERFALDRGYPRFGGSDAHSPELVGRGYTEVDIGSDRCTAESVVRAMCAGRTRPAGDRTPLRQFVEKLAYNARLKRPRPLGI